MNDKFNSFKKANEEIETEQKDSSKPKFVLPTVPKIEKKQKTVRLTPKQIEKVKRLSALTDLNFSDSLGYLIDNVSFEE